MTTLILLNFLKKLPDGIVLTYPYNKYFKPPFFIDIPKPIYVYESTSYVSAMSKKQTFLEDEVNLNITGYNWKKRRSEVENFLTSNDFAFVYDFLRENDVTYVYWIKGQRAIPGESQMGMTRIFENKEVQIYQVD